MRAKHVNSDPAYIRLRRSNGQDSEETWVTPPTPHSTFLHLPSFRPPEIPIHPTFQPSRHSDRSTPIAPSRVHFSVYQDTTVWEWSWEVRGPPPELCLWTLAILYEHTPCTLCSARSTGVSTPTREGSKLYPRFRSRGRKILDEIEPGPIEVSSLRLRCERQRLVGENSSALGVLLLRSIRPRIRPASVDLSWDQRERPRPRKPVDSPTQSLV